MTGNLQINGHDKIAGRGGKKQQAVEKRKILITVWNGG